MQAQVWESGKITLLLLLKILDLGPKQFVWDIFAVVKS